MKCKITVHSWKPCCQYFTVNLQVNFLQCMLHQNCIILIVHACPFVFAACLNKAIEVVTSLETLEETHLFLWRIGEAGGFITSHCCLGEIIEVLRRFSSMYFTFLTIAFLPLFFLSTSCSTLCMWTHPYLFPTGSYPQFLPIESFPINSFTVCNAVTGMRLSLKQVAMTTSLVIIWLNSRNM